MAKCCVYFWILWKSNGLSRNVSIFELLFFSDGEETKTAHRTLTPFVSSRNRRIAEPQSECPTRYISSSLFCTTWRPISCTHSEQSGFSGCGIARAHAYTSFFSNSNISHGLQPPLGLPSKPWMIKTFFIVYWCSRRGKFALNGKLSQPEQSEGSRTFLRKYFGAQGGTRTLTPCGTGFWNLRVYHFTTWAGFSCNNGIRGRDRTYDL